MTTTFSLTTPTHHCATEVDTWKCSTTLPHLVNTKALSSFRLPVRVKLWEVPFSFTITDQDIPNAVVDNADWTGSFDGDTTCASSYAYQWLEFTDPSGYGDCDGVELGNGVEVELLASP